MDNLRELFELNGALGGIRTPNLLIRSQTAFLLVGCGGHVRAFRSRSVDSDCTIVQTQTSGILR
jgi:hypothetical protein